MDCPAKAARVAVLFLSLCGAAADAAEPEAGALTLEQVLALARERAPRLAITATRVDAARGRLAGERRWFDDNPSLDVALGEQLSHRNEDNSFAADASILQPLELGGARGARIAGAQAAVDASLAVSDDSVRLLLRDVASVFYEGLHARERLRVARDAEGVADEVLRVSERRFRADDVPVLDVNVSRAALARARADRLEAEALYEDRLGALRMLLGLSAEEPLVLQGELRERNGLERAALLEAARQRPDLRALEAELRAAEAALRHAGTQVWPELALGAQYERDDGADTVQGLISVSPPLFDQAQGPRGISAARVRRLRLELEATRRATGVEVQTALAVSARRTAAAEELEQNALPLLDENEVLARRSYETGQIGLAELLEIRRQAFEIRREHLARRLDAALAGVELAARAGVLR